MQKGGIKLRRSPKHRGMYQAQFVRTRANKIRRLKKRLPWDQGAQVAIDRLLK